MAGVQDGPGKRPVWWIAGRALLAGLLATVLASWLGSCESSSPPPPPDVPQGAHLLPGLRMRALAGTASNLWSVGETGGGAPVVEHRTDAGWQDESGRLPTLPGLRLFGVAADGNTVWAAGQGAVAGTSATVPVVVGRDPAGTWRQAGLPAGEGYLTAVAAAGSEVWAVGEQSGRALIIHGSGGSWTSAVLASHDTQFQSVQLSAVSIAAPGEVWAVGSASDGTGEVRPLVAHGTAGRWQPTVIKSLAPAWGELTTVFALSPLDVWVGGRDEGTPDTVHIWPLLGHWSGQGLAVGHLGRPRLVDPDCPGGRHLRGSVGSWGLGPVLGPERLLQPRSDSPGRRQLGRRGHPRPRHPGRGSRRPAWGAAGHPRQGGHFRRGAAGVLRCRLSRPASGDRRRVWVVRAVSPGVGPLPSVG